MDTGPLELVCSATPKPHAEEDQYADLGPVLVARGAPPATSPDHFQLTLLLPFPQLDKLPGKPSTHLEVSVS